MQKQKSKHLKALEIAYERWKANCALEKANHLLDEINKLRINNKILMDQVIAIHLYEIVKAFSEGKKIERRCLKYSPCQINNLDEILDWGKKDPMSLYIKEEPKYRPYKNAEEFLKAQKEHGPNVKFKDSYYMPVGFDDIGGKIFGINYSYPALKLDYLWQDGTPCGIKE